MKIFSSLATALLLVACTQTDSNSTNENSAAVTDQTSAPDPSRFQVKVLANNLNEPLEFDILPDGRILFIERTGRLRLLDPKIQKIKTIHSLDVNTTLVDGGGSEDGLLGLALDPNFATNGWLYLYYSLAGDKPVNVLTRWTFKNDALQAGSGKRVLEVPVQREQCCHTGGAIEFDREGHLYLSTGDNTNPHASHYAPIDERPGRSPWDAQKSSANTNDLRGKILRILPLADGSYAIPEGNLFPPGTANTRPEIYAMGVRNPYRISIDPVTSYLYWGDVGPDASRLIKEKGPIGYDEINQLREPGFFGWPYFIGDNQAYAEFDFATKKSLGNFNPHTPINNSPNNTGLQSLPPAQGAFIWYSYAKSSSFPELGKGGRTAMAGPVYRHQFYADQPSPFPAWFDNKLFIYEWMRGWVNTVTLSESGDYVSMQRFLPEMSFSAPVDMLFGPDGSLYILEYGRAWFQPNADARIVRVDYIQGNRNPVARATLAAQHGALPFEVSLSAEGSTDPDGDQLSYLWQIKNAEGQAIAESSEKDFHYRLTQAGQYQALLTVTDQHAAHSQTSFELLAGNSPPEVHLDIVEGNSMFFFPNTPIRYQARVSDSEDGDVKAEDVALTLDFLPVGFDKVDIQQGHLAAENAANMSAGEKVISQSDCTACHKKHGASIGPSYVDIARYYKENNDKNTLNAQAHLVDKIIQGGSGVWGETAMPPHQDMSVVEARLAVKYILAVDEEKIGIPLPLAGEYTIKQEDIIARDGTVILRAAYEDKGAGDLPSIKTEKTLTLDNPYIDANEIIAEKEINFLTVSDPPISLKVGLKDGAFLQFPEMDLNGVSGLHIHGNADPEFTVGGYIELRLGDEHGTLLGKTAYFDAKDIAGRGFSKTIAINQQQGQHKLTFIFRNDDKNADKALFIITGFTLLSGNEHN